MASQRRSNVGLASGGGESGGFRVVAYTAHPHAGGRVYAAYGGIYIGTALLWLWLIDGLRARSLGCDWRDSVACWYGRDLFRPACLEPADLAHSGALWLVVAELHERDPADIRSRPEK